MHLMRVHLMLTAALATTCAGAAESPFLMPEGTSEFTVGAALRHGENDEDSGRRGTWLQPYWQAQWSNGIFLDGVWLGRQMSDVPHLRYGPMLTLARERLPRGGEDHRLMPVFGGFLSYQLLHNLRFSVHGYRMAGSRGDAMADLQLMSYHSVVPHHGLSFMAGLRLADRRHLQAHLGAGAEASGGVKDAYAGARWHWELTPKYTASVGLEYKRLGGDAADARGGARRSSLDSHLLLLYRF